MEIAISVKMDFHTIYNEDPYYSHGKDFENKSSLLVFYSHACQIILLCLL
jgi:hypothetical protein